jgi:hypothetical protein
MAQMLMVNPRKRRRTKSKRRSVRRRRNPTTSLAAAPKRRARRRYSRNPIGTKDLMKQTITAATMAGGGIITDIVTSRLPIPQDIKTGQFAPLVRAGVAVALGMGLDKGLKQRELGRNVTQGALVIIAHDTITKLVGSRIGLSAYEEMNAYPMDGYGDLIIDESDLGEYGDNLLGNELLGLGNMYDDVVTMSGMGEYQNAAPLAGVSATYDMGDEFEEF